MPRCPRSCGCEYKPSETVEYSVNIPSDTFAKISRIDATLADIRRANQAGGNNIGQFVVYDLPDRDCAAAASNGEYAIIDGGEEKYKNYINTIRDVLKKYSDIRTVLVIGMYPNG